MISDLKVTLLTKGTSVNNRNIPIYNCNNGRSRVRHVPTSEFSINFGIYSLTISRLVCPHGKNSWSNFGGVVLKWSFESKIYLWNNLQKLWYVYHTHVIMDKGARSHLVVAMHSVAPRSQLVVAMHSVAPRSHLVVAMQSVAPRSQLPTQPPRRGHAVSCPRSHLVVVRCTTQSPRRGHAVSRITQPVAHAATSS